LKHNIATPTLIPIIVIIGIDKIRESELPFTNDSTKKPYQLALAMLNQITPIIHSNHNQGRIQFRVLTEVLSGIKPTPDFERACIKRANYGLKPLYFN
jgi:hypothetical protein